ncbi:hypothetical protein NSA19_07510 [Actinomyces bowdenii]|uniref:hypothetical protein n=1 Tax=Actinomyces bowdenii TaxID=131109 RepID=UPI00214ADC64|nr:hypothetical protein [Actinomyces bowdenii]MCR2052695.1 hypothetical protein [Actinomyces bowdenii]
MPDQEEDQDGRVENRKLTAISNLQESFNASKSRINEWTTDTHRIPVANGDPNTNPAIFVGGGTSESLSEGLGPDVWDSPAATTYQTKISDATGAVDTALATMEQDITSAKNHQEFVVGEKVEPGTVEAEWGR